jgi:hypothetical protein
MQFFAPNPRLSSHTTAPTSAIAIADPLGNGFDDPDSLNNEAGYYYNADLDGGFTLPFNSGLVAGGASHIDFGFTGSARNS